MKTHTRGRARRSALSLRSVHRIVSIFTLMFMLTSLLAPIASQTAFAQDATPTGDQTIVVQPAEQPAAPVSEEPAAPVVEEPAAPVVEEPAAPVVEEPAAPVVEDPAAPVVEEPAAPVVEEPAAPVVEEPAAPAVDEPAAPAVEAPADTTSSVEAVVDPVEEVVADPSAATCAASNATVPSIASDLADYAPGSTVTLTGSGWVPGQTVDIFVDDDGVADAEMGAWSLFQKVDADQNGNIFFQFSIPNWFVADYFVTATGECTNATTAFTDAQSTWVDFSTFPTTASIGNSYTMAATSKVKNGNVLSSTPTGVPVSFASNTPVVCTVSGSTLTIVASGLCTVIASSPRMTVNGIDYGSSDASKSVTISDSKSNQTITFNALDTKTYGDAPFTVSASASSSLTVSFTSTGACTVTSAGQVTINSAGSCLITASQAGNANFNPAPSVSQTLTIAPKAITVTVVAGQSKVYGAADPTFLYTSSPSLVTGDSFTGALSRGGGEDVGPYAINQGTLALNSNYTINFVGGTFQITAAPVTFTVNSASVQYDGTAKSVSVAGVPGGATVSFAYSQDETPVAAPTEVGTYAVVATLSGNYSGSAEGTLTITAAPSPLTVENVTFQYDGSTHEVVVQGIPSGLEDKVIVTYNGTADLPLNVGTYNVVATLNSANYTGEATATVSITAQPVTFDVANVEVTYDGNAHGVVVEGVPTDAIVSITYNGGAAEPVNAGTYDVVVTLSGNYSGSAEATVQINRADLTIVGADLTKVYGEDDPESLDGSVSGILTGDEVIVSFDREPGEDVGDYAITATVSGADAANYTVNETLGNLKITPAGLTIDGADLTKVYGADDPESLKGTVTGVVEGDEVTVTFTRVTGENVGPHAINATVSGADAGNYEVLSNTPGNLEITARSITVMVDAGQTKVYGNPDPELTYEVTDGELAFDDNFTGALTRETGEDVNTYGIGQGDLALSGNYTLTVVPGEFEITARPVQVTVDAGQTKVYGNPDPALTYQVSSGSLATGDSFTGSLTRETGEDVNTYGIGQGDLALSGNYTLTVVPGTFEIMARPITVTVTPGQTKVYGDLDPAEFTYSITEGELVNNDEFSGTLSRVGGEDVKTYAIERNTLTLGNNYDLTFEGGDFTITAKSVTVTVKDATKVYGATDPSFSFESPGLVGEDKLELNYERVPGENVGKYDINATVKSGGANYDVNFVNGSLTITAKPVDVSAKSYTVEFGKDLPTFEFTVSSATPLVSGDVLNGKLSLDREVTGKGTYTIQIGTLQTANPNYRISFTNGTLTVTPRVTRTITVNQPLDVSGTANTAKAGSTIPIKFNLVDENGQQVSSLNGVSVVIQAVSCTATNGTEDVIETVTSTGNTPLRWDGTQFHQNWKTSGKAGNCFRITISANHPVDGTPLDTEVVYVKLK